MPRISATTSEALFMASGAVELLRDMLENEEPDGFTPTHKRQLDDMVWTLDELLNELDPVPVHEDDALDLVELQESFKRTNVVDRAFAAADRRYWTELAIACAVPVLIVSIAFVAGYLLR